MAVATVGGLLVATAAAFAITEKLKLTPTPILDTLVSKTFSPVCRCETASATISFRLRRGGRMEVDIVRPGGALVRRLAHHRFSAGFQFFRWFGRDQSGAMSTDGDYKVRVALLSQHRTIVFPNIIRLDTTPPTIERFGLGRHAAYVGERIRISYRFTQSAHPILLVDDRVAVIGRFARTAGTIDWFGKVNGRRVRSGVHRLALEARDVAGNVSTPTAATGVRIRPTVTAHHRRRHKPKR